jgi:hypothetical protein
MEKIRNWIETKLELYKGWLLWSVISVFIIVGFPFFMDKFIIGSDVSSNITNSEWVSFLGSYVGSLLGGITSIVGIIITIEYTKKETSDERKIAEKRLKEDRRLSKAPFIIASLNNNSDTPLKNRTTISIKNYAPEKVGYSEICKISLTNIGNGAMLNPRLIFASIKMRDNYIPKRVYALPNVELPTTKAILVDEALDVHIHLADNLFVKRDMLSYFIVTFKIQYVDVMNYRYKQEIEIVFHATELEDFFIPISSDIEELNRIIKYDAKEETLKTTVLEIVQTKDFENILSK